jgi:hypothetical protein
MMGLLDNPNDVGLLSLGLRLMSTPGKFGAAFGQAGMGAMGDMQQAQQAQQQAKTRALQEQMLQEQLAAAKRQQETAAVAAAQRARDNGILQGAFQPMPGPMPDGSPGVPPRFDLQGMLARGLSMDSVPEALKLQSALSPPRKLRDVAPGASVIDEADPTKPVFTSPKEATPTELSRLMAERDKFPPGHPARATYESAIVKATSHQPGTSVNLPKIELKMGESVAGQIGPMAKDSKVQVGGAVTMWDAASRIEKALESGKVTSGPLASKVQTVKQLVQTVAGGNDESIRQTQQVIRGLSKMAVEARKQLAGQGQVTESEARAVEKADGGNIDDLTTGELGDLVKLTKRAAHMTAKSHQELINEMEASDATRGSAPFYRVRGLEPLLKHDPQLPQIGGPKPAARVSSDADYNALPSGATFIAPDGSTRRKP